MADAMWVKICGTTNLPEALLALEHGADALGFIFAPSKRRITVAQAAAITAHLPPGAERVGVFTSASVAEILATVSEAGLTAVQLHRPHDPVLTAELDRTLGAAIRLIQVVGISADREENPTFPDGKSCVQSTGAEPPEGAKLQEGNEAKLTAAFADPSLWAVLLDTEKCGQSGGLGLPFSWEALRPVLQRVLANSALRNPGPSETVHRPRLLLAGGLTAGNVRQGIEVLEPWGVDCVSGVESEPGRKDPVSLAGFLRAARQAR